MPLHDAHNHLQDAHLSSHVRRVAETWPGLAGIDGTMVVNGTHPSDWELVAALANTHAFINPAFGIHPWDAGAPRVEDWLAQLREHLLANPCASIGEIGLDRWILESASPEDPRLTGVRRASLDEQVATFLPQLALAATLNRPASIHCLHAYDDLLPLLRAHPLPRVGFLLHAYSGPAKLVPELVALGAYFSYNPSFLHPHRSRQHAAFRAIPDERLLCETDAPAMAPPLAWRTHKLPPASDGSLVNHPGNIEAAYVGLAILREKAPAALTALIDANFTRLFGSRKTRDTEQPAVATVSQAVA